MSMNVGSVARNRVTGLMTGMDTAEMVRAMLTGHQSRLNRANQHRELINWRKDSYRVAVNRLTGFQSRFLDLLSNDSILRAGNFRTETASLSNAAMSRYFSVTGSTVTSGSFTVNSISQLATAHTIESTTTGLASISFVASMGSIQDLAGRSLTFTVNGDSRTISFSQAEIDGLAFQGMGMESFQELLNEKLASAFGTQAGVPVLQFAPPENIPLASGAHGTHYWLRLEVAPGNAVTVRAVENQAGTALGFSGTLSNRMDPNRSIHAPWGDVRFSINGVEFSFSNGTRMSDIMNEINRSDAGVTMSYSQISDSFTLVSNRTGTGDNIVMRDLALTTPVEQAGGTVFYPQTSFLRDLFGGEHAVNIFGEVTGEVIIDDPSRVTEGQNAILQVNGVDIERASNYVTLEGITIRLNQITTRPDSTFIATSAVASADPDRTISAITSFVEEFNSMMQELNAMLTERRPRARGSFFMPLTNEQREEMSQSEIERWEEEGRRGLLHNDPSLSRVVSQLRMAVMNPVRLSDGRTVSLADIGIRPANFNDDRSGALVINEEQLREAILRDPQMVEALFTAQSPYTAPERFDGTENSLGRINSLIEAHFSMVYDGTNRGDIAGFLRTHNIDWPRDDFGELILHLGQRIPDRHGNIIGSEQDFRSALSGSQGLGRRFEDIFTNAVHVSSNEHLRGGLIRTAGTGGANSFVDSTSALARQISRQDSLIERITRRMETEEDRLFMRFARLETALARMSSQSAFFGMEQPQ